MKKLKLLALLAALILCVTAFAACDPEKPMVTGIEVSGSKISEGYILKGAELPADMKIKLIYADSTKSEDIAVTADMIAGYNKNTAGVQTVKITYSGFEFKFDIVVADKIVDGAIGTAIAEAAAGQTLFVKSGTYADNFEIDKSIVLLGANVGVNANKADWTAAVRKTETIVTGAIKTAKNVGNVVIDGFRFERKTDAVESGTVTVGENNGKVTVQNCVAQNPRAGNSFINFWQSPAAHDNAEAVIKNNRIIDVSSNGLTEGLASGGSNYIYLARVMKIDVSGNYLGRTVKGATDSNAGINLGAVNGDKISVKNNCSHNLALIIGGENGTTLSLANFTGNVFTGDMRDGTSSILEFNKARTIVEIQTLIAANTFPAGSLPYMLAGKAAITETAGVATSYGTLQQALTAAAAGSKVYVSSSAVTIDTLPAVKLTLVVGKNTVVTGDGATGISGAGTYQFNGTAWVKQ